MFYFSTSVIDPEPILSGIEEYQSDIFAYSALIVAVTALGLFIKSLIH